MSLFLLDTDHLTLPTDTRRAPTAKHAADARHQTPAGTSRFNATNHGSGRITTRRMPALCHRFITAGGFGSSVACVWRGRGCGAGTGVGCDCGGSTDAATLTSIASWSVVKMPGTTVTGPRA
jgi:hypothetical protein